MNITTIVLLSLLSISIILYIISLIKNWKIPLGITSNLFIPLACTPAIIALSEYLPDSYHLRFLSIVAVALISVSEVFIYFRFYNFMTIPGEFLYTLSIIAWICLYKSTFYVFKATNLSLIIEGSILLIILFALLIYLKPQHFFKCLLRAFQLGALGFVNYCGLLTLLNTNKNYGYTLFIGSTLMIFEFIFYSVQTTKPVKINRKVERLIRTSLITSAEVLITVTGYFMISN